LAGGVDGTEISTQILPWCCFETPTYELTVHHANLATTGTLKNVAQILEYKRLLQDIDQLAVTHSYVYKPSL